MKKIKADGGRFLCSVGGDSPSYYEITDEDARLKAAQRKASFHEKFSSKDLSHMLLVSLHS